LLALKHQAATFEFREAGLSRALNHCDSMLPDRTPVHRLPRRHLRQAKKGAGRIRPPGLRV